MLKIAFSGRQCAGKTTAAGFIREILTYMIDDGDIYNSHIEYVKFAEPLYSAQKIFSEKKDRIFLQELGDLVRKRFGEDFFTKCAQHKIRKSREGYPLAIVVDDLRFEDEFFMLKDEGFLIVYIDSELENRLDRANTLGVVLHENHKSEEFIEGIKKRADVILSNDSGILEFKESLKDMLYYTARHRDFMWCWM